ncbi:hypothetical protein M378DRAFT_165525 [Amanita muscaria Koide BX008]|uniref:Uncharacterized protein n=1 Tax=Amanita muscaria (strain Koide BX008) TaxID=946122 RepID=A0A0C2WM83_AMAMK|nr:hypothetical protein M378DRAFT_165525 [Amanita muscaria Koide BX008]
MTRRIRRCASLFTTNSRREEKSETIGLRTFRYFLSEIATWARDEKVVLTRRVDKDVAVHELIDRLFSGKLLAEERCTSK